MTNDVLLVYFVGHGTIGRRSQLYLTLTDTEEGDEDLTGMEYSKVRDVLYDSAARVKIVILDCCYSGRAIESLAAKIADIADIRGTYVLTASDTTAHVVPLEQQSSRATSFTEELTAVVRAGIPGGPAMLSLTALYPHLRRRLQARGLPAPNQHNVDQADRFDFTCNAAYVTLPAPASAFSVAHLGVTREAALVPEVRPRRVLPVYVVFESSVVTADGPAEAMAKGFVDLCIELGSSPTVDELTRICLMTFSDVAKVAVPLVRPGDLPAIPRLETHGVPRYGPVFDLLTKTIAQDTNMLRTEGFRILRPVVVFMTGGRPTDAESWPTNYARLVDPAWVMRPNILSFGFGDADPSAVLRIATTRGFLGDTVTVTEAMIAYIQTLITSINSSAESEVLSSSDNGGVRIIVPDSTPGWTAIDFDVI
jgi:uncharacterized protein YegL